MPAPKKNLLIISQVYLPDPAAVGQYMADVAEEMARDGWEVTVLTSQRGYDNPEESYPGKEVLNGVDVIRLPLSSFGKKTIIHRLVGQSLFCLQAALRGIFKRRLDSILVTTSPPIGGMIGWFVSLVRRKPFHFWVMDLNPDQAIAQGVVKSNSLPARIFNFLNRRYLKRASSVIALDEFMAENLKKKVPGLESKIHIIPPWPMEDSLEIIPRSQNPFIKKHQLEGKFVLMYSGNHSPVHPLKTFLEAARELEEREDLAFLFVGGGKGKAEVDAVISEHSPKNLISLPYQPLDEIKFSLSSAHIHLVSMGGPMIGCVHPCKFYNSLLLAKPILYLGPRESHIGQIIAETGAGWQIEHGDNAKLVDTIREISKSNDLERIGQLGRTKALSDLSRDALCRRFCRLLSNPQ